MLDAVLPSGSDANQHALIKATKGDMETALFAIGNYLGGNEFLQNHSTSWFSFSGTFSETLNIEDASPACIYHTVVLPYLVPQSMAYKSKIDSEAYSEELEKYEDQCLRLLQKKLLSRILNPKAKEVRVILLEYLLSGNGGELRVEFLVKLGRLLKAFGVKVIADEVLTGGRVGPTMTMTQSLPKEWKENVEYVTMGKWTGCGLVLKRAPSKPVPVQEQLRGYSTKQECGEVFQLWQLVAKKIDNGDIQKRQNDVVMKLLNSRHGNPLQKQQHTHRVHLGERPGVVQQVHKTSESTISQKPIVA